MSPTALALVLAAACLHALWNFWLKQANAPGNAFVLATTVVSVVGYAPFVLLLYMDDLLRLGAAAWLAMLASALIHVGYFAALQRGYARADLSVVYPVARGIGPLLAATSAIVWLGEAPTIASITGLLLIVGGTFVIAGGLALLRAGHSPRVRTGLAWGALTGTLIAAYTVNDGRAVRLLGVAPLLFDWLSIAIRAVLIAPVVLARPAELRAVVQRVRWQILGVGLVSPLAYVLVLEAMRRAPISRVAPARELSMLIAAFIGARLLAEGELARRLSGAALIASGVGCLALSR